LKEIDSEKYLMILERIFISFSSEENEKINWNEKAMNSALLKEKEGILVVDWTFPKMFIDNTLLLTFFSNESRYGILKVVYNRIQVECNGD
jgi:hypothetical protein